MVVRHLVFVLVILGLSACFSNPRLNNGLLNRLTNRGPVALSSDNPYLVGNLVLASIVKDSPVLQGFISHRGVPPAIELQRGTFSPYTLLLYYPESRELYTYEQSDPEGIVDGPTAIDKEALKKIATLTRNLDNEPKLLTAQELAALQRQPLNTESPPAAPAISTPRPSANTPEPFRSAAALSPGTSPSPESFETVVARTTAQAEVSPKGDVVHYVTAPGETLTMIAKWYTGDKSNTGRLARINALKNPSQLDIGDMVVIPVYLVSNKKRLTGEAVQILKRAPIE